MTTDLLTIRVTNIFRSFYLQNGGKINQHRYGTIVGFVAAAVSMPMGGCRARRSLVVDVDVAAELAVLWLSMSRAIILLCGSGCPLGYPKVTPIKEELTDPKLPCPPTGEWPPSGRSCGWVDTDPATSIGCDSSPSTDSTLDPTIVDSETEAIVVSTSRSPELMSSGSTSLRALARVL